MIDETEVLVILDRADTAHADRGFFAYVAGDGAVSIRHMAAAEAAAFTIAGRVAVVVLPFDEATMQRTGTWLEEEED